MWLEQPAPTADDDLDARTTTAGWETRVLITDGPDVAFVVIDADGDGRAQVVATEFFVHQVRRNDVAHTDLVSSPLLN